MKITHLKSLVLRITQCKPSMRARTGCLFSTSWFLWVFFLFVFFAKEKKTTLLWTWSIKMSKIKQPLKGWGHSICSPKYFGRGSRNNDHYVEKMALICNIVLNANRRALSRKFQIRVEVHIRFDDKQFFFHPRFKLQESRGLIYVSTCRAKMIRAGWFLLTDMLLKLLGNALKFLALSQSNIWQQGCAPTYSFLELNKNAKVYAASSVKTALKQTLSTLCGV